MKQNIQYFKTTDIESSNPALSNNGGDYYFGRTIAVNVLPNGKGVPLAVRYWTSADFDFCHLCGSFQRTDDEHFGRWHHPKDRAKQSEGEGWENGTVSNRFSGNDWQNPELFVKLGS